MQNELAKIRQTESDMKRELAEMRGSIQKFEDSQNQSLDTSRQPVTAYEQDHQPNTNTSSSLTKQEVDK